MNIESKISGALIQKPIVFKLNGKRYEVYPFSLGKMQVLGWYMAELDLTGIDYAPYETLYRICQTRKGDVCKIISICTMNDKGSLIDDSVIAKRAERFEKAGIEDLATCLALIFSMPTPDMFFAHFGIDKDIRDKEEVNRIKSSKGTVVFGGKSIWGALLDTACAKYGWSIEYILWDISYMNLQMMITDSLSSVYLTDDEQKKIGTLPSEYADDPENAAKIINRFNKLTHGGNN